MSQWNTVSNGVPLVALFGSESAGLVNRRVRTMLRVAPAATTDGSIRFWGAFPGRDAMDLRQSASSAGNHAMAAMQS